MEPMPRSVSRRILSLCEKGEVVVVVPRKNKPSRVFMYEKYQVMKRLPGKVRPWEGRAAARKEPDPLAAVEGSVKSPMDRRSIYP